MAAQNEYSDKSKLPSEFFDDSSFKTLYGGVMVTWVATSAIADVWGSIDPKMLGFIVAIVVAFVGYFISENRSIKKLLITPFNGLLIYLTIMGGTSFLPAPQTSQAMNNTTTQVQDTTDHATRETQNAKPISTFFTSWNPNQELIQQTSQLKKENHQLELKAQKLQQINTTYKTKLDSTRRVIQDIQMSPEVRKNLMNNLDINSQLNNSSFEFNQTP